MSDPSPVIRTPDQRLRVFVSSTMKELAAERAVVLKAVQGLRMSPVLFEMGARPHPARDLYRAYLAQSHIFIGIYWQQYGWVAPDMSISGLEDEFRLASDLPRLIYVKRPAPERDEGLQRLLNDIKNDEGISYKYFSNPDELEHLVADDLALLLTERFEQSRQVARATGRAAPESGSAPAGLPRNPNPLIGRAEALAGLGELLRDERTRLVTLTGPGGVGKTSLSLEAGAALRPHFPDGVYWVPLASIRAAQQVPAEIARALDVRERQGVPLEVSLADYLRDRKLLLMLDNFEQVLPAGVAVAELLANAPGIKALVTSRAALRVRAEHELPLPPLGLPGADDADRPPRLEASAAVRLFVERAQAVDPSFALNGSNAAQVGEIVRRLDGLPLAIELAAARVRLMPPEAILARLDAGLKLLTGGARDLPERQQTMRNTIEWSYDLLDPEARSLFCRLSLFEGGFSLPAAEAVAGDGQDVLEGIQALVDNSLLRRAEPVGGVLRFNMLEIVREYAFERLAGMQDYAQTRQRWGDYYHQVAVWAEKNQYSNQAQEFLARLNADFENYRAAIEWFNTRPGELRKSWEIIITLVWLCYRTGSMHISRRWLAHALQESEHGADPVVRGKLLSNAGLIAMWQSDLKNAELWLDAGLRILRAEDSPLDLAVTLFQSGVLGINQANPGRARPALEEALGMVRRFEMQWLEAIIQLHLGNVALKEADVEAAYAFMMTSLALSRQVGDGWLIASAINNLGEIARCRGQYAQAEEHYLESRRIFDEVGSEPDVARAGHSLAYVALARGDFEAAEALFSSSLELHQKLGIKRGVVECRIGLACAGVDSGEGELALHAIAAGLEEFKSLGTEPWPADRLEIERRFNAFSHSTPSPPPA